METVLILAWAVAFRDPLLPPLYGLGVMLFFMPSWPSDSYMNGAKGR